MKKLFVNLMLGLFLSNSALALPQEVTDDSLQVLSVELLMDALPNTFYIFQKKNVIHETKNGVETALGWIGLQLTDSTCAMAAVWVESPSCGNIQTCKVQGVIMPVQTCTFDKVPTISKIAASLTQTRSARRFQVVRRCSGPTQPCVRVWTPSKS